MAVGSSCSSYTKRARLERTIINLEKRSIPARLFMSKHELLSYVKSVIPNGSTVGVGDSMTLDQLGLISWLRGGGFCFLDKYDQSLSPQDKRSIYLRNFDADFFLSGINAISEEGEIFNLDGNGSRVAPIIYGPRKVILIAGSNKVVKNEGEAIQRIKRVAAPQDAIRLEKKTPCAITGTCVDCRSSDRICNYLTSIKSQFNPNRIEVLLVSCELGL
jgi:hypothetical protein